MQAKKDSSELEAKSKAMKGKLAVLEEQVKAAETTLDAAVCPIGNLVHDSVPVSNDEVSLARNAWLKAHTLLRTICNGQTAAWVVLYIPCCISDIHLS